MEDDSWVPVAVLFTMALIVAGLRAIYRLAPDLVKRSGLLFLGLALGVAVCSLWVSRYSIVSGRLSTSGNREHPCFLKLDRWTGRTFILSGEGDTLASETIWIER